MMTVISVVTPSFNQSEFLEETIRSVLLQEGNFYIDYIIMDGGSKDKSLEIIKKYENLLAEHCEVLKKDGLEWYVKKNKDFPWNNCLGIGYRWKSQEDNGQTDAINQGLKMAAGQVLAFLNSDDLYYPDTFKKILQTRWKGTDLVYGHGMWVSEKGKDILLYPTFKPDKYSFFYQCTLCQPTVFFTRQLFEELGNFSMEFQHVFDYEYWMRAIFNKKKFLFINAPLAKSRMYKQNKSLSRRNDVSQQVTALKKKYYWGPGQKLNKLRLLASKYTVQRKTVSRVNKLQKYLGTGIRYRFWFKKYEK